MAESRIRGMMKRIEGHTGIGPCAREQRTQKIRRLPQSTDVLLVITQKGYRRKDFSLFQDLRTSHCCRRYRVDRSSGLRSPPGRPVECRFIEHVVAQEAST